ncbi:hypothetical protein HELRODRAFT_192782 [Helobdella robusta]|uniref:Uncharacterized protein n=1 Tax=Helobdella robusta TaxID=6412 RepID=T1FUA2_HELRO|nr:hypothetical protein HELRODRAFT_192782 [Helobdella robusta]ESN99769.1 hypothetical protein HELRODRAFT_192782 [Helobdella robusta]
MEARNKPPTPTGGSKVENLELEDDNPVKKNPPQFTDVFVTAATSTTASTIATTTTTNNNIITANAAEAATTTATTTATTSLFSNPKYICRGRWWNLDGNSATEKTALLGYRSQDGSESSSWCGSIEIGEEAEEFPAETRPERRINADVGAQEVPTGLFFRQQPRHFTIRRWDKKYFRIAIGLAMVILALGGFCSFYVLYKLRQRNP